MSDAPSDSDEREPGGQGGKRGRGKTITIVILAIVLALVIAAIIWLLVARGTKPSAPATTTPTPVVTPTPTASTPRPTPTSTTTGAAVARCTVNQLSVTLASPSGAAGSTIVPIVFTNTGSTPCELHGFPGVSFVGNGNGTQLGAAADQDASVPITQNTLAPGSSVQAPLKISQAQNYQGCTVVQPDGFRVYPPHSYESVFVKSTAYKACSNADIHLLSVQVVQSK